MEKQTVGIKDYVMKMNKSFIIDMYEEYANKKYYGVLMRLCTLGCNFLEMDFDELSKKIWKEYNEMNIEDYASLEGDNEDFWTELSWYELMGCYDFESFNEEFIKMDGIYSKLYRLAIKLTDYNIVFLNNQFNGGSGFCYKSNSIFEYFNDECKGVIGWYTQNAISESESITLLSHKNNLQSNLGNHDDTLINSDAMITCLKKVGLKIVSNEQFPEVQMLK